MPAWLHRTTKQLLASVAAADLPEAQANYIEEPDLIAVTGFPSKYWIITGDVVTLMSPAERAVVDQAELDAIRDSLVSELNDLELRDRAIILSLLDIVNFLSQQLTDIKSAATSSANYRAFSTAISGINASPQRTISEILTLIRTKLGS